MDGTTQADRAVWGDTGAGGHAQCRPGAPGWWELCPPSCPPRASVPLLTSSVPDLGPQTGWKSRATYVARGFWHRGSRLQEKVTLGSLDSEGSHCHKVVSSRGHRPAPLVGALAQATPARPPHPLPFMNHTGRLQMSLGSWPQMSLAGDLGSPKGPIQASAGLWKPTQDPGGRARPGDGVGGPPDG